jgi:hypothetical protein
VVPLPIKPKPDPDLPDDWYEIDLYRLDEAWVSQVRLYHHFALKLADAQADWDRAKAATELAWAELAQDVRRNPTKYGAPKTTEDAVKEIVQMQREYQHAVAAEIDARHAVEVLRAAMGTLDNRKKGLEKAVDLFLSDYFAEPRKPAGAGREAAEKFEYKAAFEAEGRRGKKK